MNVQEQTTVSHQPVEQFGLKQQSGGDGMNTSKSLLTRLSETFDEYRADRRRAQDPLPQHSRPRRFLRWMTPNGGTLLLIAVLLLTQNVWARQTTSPAAPGPSATTVNYQGRLADSGGTPLDGTYGMSFSLWDAATDGNLVWGPENHTAVPVSEGLFSVGLGSQTSGGIPTTVWNGDRYLEITVGGETLSPRELIRSVPIAGMALTVPDGAITTDKIVEEAITQMVTVGASSRANNNTTTFEDMPDMVATIETEGGPVMIDFSTNYKRSVANGAGIVLQLNIDGNDVPDSIVNGRVTIADQWHTVAFTYITTLSPGSHTVKVRWRMSVVNSSGTLTALDDRRLTVMQFKR
jgi:hypothetical protein